MAGIISSTAVKGAWGPPPLASRYRRRALAFVDRFVPERFVARFAPVFDEAFASLGRALVSCFPALSMSRSSSMKAS